MIRALAGAWFELLSDYAEDGIVELFSSLAPIMVSPLPKGSPWVQGDLADAFYLNSAGQHTSPNAHRGIDKKLVAAIVRWGRTRPAWLKKPPDRTLQRALRHAPDGLPLHPKGNT